MQEINAEVYQKKKKMKTKNMEEIAIIICLKKLILKLIKAESLLKGKI